MNLIADIRMRGFLKRTPIKDFLSLIKENSQILPAEKISTVEASGRILSQKIVAPQNVPNFDRSAMDGYAVRANDILGASKDAPVLLKNIGVSAAGQPFEHSLGTGECIQCTLLIL